MTDASTIDAVQPKARRLSFKELPGFDISAEALLKLSKCRVWLFAGLLQ